MAIIEIKRTPLIIPAAILTAGISNKMKSYEPRALLKIGNDVLVERQIKTIRYYIDSEILLVVGYKANKIIRRVSGIPNVRIIENQNFDTTNAAESIRLAVNNNTQNSLLVMHGDILFNADTLKDLSFNKSFVIIDSHGQIKDREVGLSIDNNTLMNLSYDLTPKWCQIAYFTGKEYQILKSICKKEITGIENKLLFEVLNLVVGKGGLFNCIEPPKMKILEIDSMGDIYEDTNSK